MRHLYGAVSASTLRSGLLSDELSGSSSANPEELDRRMSAEYEMVTVAEGANSAYGRWQATRYAATFALPVVRANAAPGARQAPDKPER